MLSCALLVRGSCSALLPYLIIDADPSTKKGSVRLHGQSQTVCDNSGSKMTSTDEPHYAPTDPLLGSDNQQLRDESRPGDSLALYTAVVRFSQVLNSLSNSDH